MGGDGFDVAFSFPLLQAATQDVLDRRVLAWWFSPGVWGEQWEDPGNLGQAGKLEGGEVRGNVGESQIAALG